MKMTVWGCTVLFRCYGGRLTTRTLRQGFCSWEAYGLRVAGKEPGAGDFLPFLSIYMTLMERLLWASEWGVKMGVASFSK